MKNLRNDLSSGKLRAIKNRFTTIASAHLKIAEKIQIRNFQRSDGVQMEEKNISIEEKSFPFEK